MDTSTHTHASWEPAILGLGVYPHEMRAYAHENTCTQMFVNFLFVTAINYG